MAFAQDAITDVVASAHENSIKTIFPHIGELDDTNAIIARIEQCDDVTVVVKYAKLLDPTGQPSAG